MENLPLMFYVRSPVPLFRGGSGMLNQNVIYPFVDFVVNVNNSRKSNTEALLLTENISSFPCTWNTRTSLISSLVVYFRTRFISHSTSFAMVGLGRVATSAANSGVQSSFCSHRISLFKEKPSYKCCVTSCLFCSVHMRC